MFRNKRFYYKEFNQLYALVDDNWIDYDKWCASPPNSDPDTFAQMCRPKDAWFTLTEVSSILSVPYCMDEICAIRSDCETDLILYANGEPFLTLHMESNHAQHIAIPILCLKFTSLSVTCSQPNAHIEVLGHYLDFYNREYLQSKNLLCASYGMVVYKGAMKNIEKVPKKIRDMIDTSITIGTNIKGFP